MKKKNLGRPSKNVEVQDPISNFLAEEFFRERAKKEDPRKQRYGGAYRLPDYAGGEQVNLSGKGDLPRNRNTRFLFDHPQVRDAADKISEEFRKKTSKVKLP